MDFQAFRQSAGVMSGSAYTACWNSSTLTRYGIVQNELTRCVVMYFYAFSPKKDSIQG